MKKYTFDEIVGKLDEAFPEMSSDWDMVAEFADKYDLYFFSGETRWCLYQSHWAEVIKIPRFDNVNDDYGAIEVANYHKACDLGIERIFLPTRLVCVLKGGCPVYAQKKFTSDHCGHSNRKALEKVVANCVNRGICEKARHGMYQSHRIDRAWFARAYQIYGKKFMRVVEEFTRDERIGDLHQRNLGWLGKQPIILDFAGYHG